MKPDLHRVAKFGGIVFALLSFLYLTHILWEKWHQIIRDPGTTKLLYVVVPSGVIYGLICILLAFGWHHMLSMLDHSVGFSKAYSIYARSQIGKYLPGNVFHYAGRQVMGRSAGLRHNALLTATTYETLFLITASVGVTVAGIPALNMGPSHKKIIFIVGVLVIVCIFTSVWLFRPFALKFPAVSKYLGNLPNFHTRDWISFVFTPLTTYVVFFLLLGTLISAMASISFSLVFSIKQMVIFSALYAASWTLGFLTPGCPGGIGIREGVLTAGLMQFVEPSSALSLAFGLRAVTISGDIFFYFTSHISLKKANRSAL